MSIWDYAQTPDGQINEFCGKSNCPFCRQQLRRLSGPDLETINYHTRTEMTVGVCQSCGWWNVQQDVREKIDAFRTQVYDRGSYGVLKNLNVKDIRIPLQEVRDYLTVNYGSRFALHPRLFEETVGSVFSDHGYSVEVTAYSNDGGIDVILTDSDARIGVQVKRYKDVIEAEEIRAFAGALVINGLTKGMFVTTSSFRAGAERTAEASTNRGWPIELLDAERFYSALQISQRKAARTPEEWISEVIPRLRTLNSFSTLDESGFYEDD